MLPAPTKEARVHAIAICGSPRKEGNTEYLLRRCLARLGSAGATVELISLADKRIEPCRACDGCGQRKDGTCAMGGDDFSELLERMRAADAIVVGSPVYFGSATPQLMALLDRAGYVSRRNGHFFSRKLGGAVVVARRAGQNFTLAQLLFWFLANDMIVPGSTYWNMAQGREPGEVANDAEGIAAVERFADNLAWLGKSLRSE
jgi:multimeric flavodoxin WrbA